MNKEFAPGSCTVFAGTGSAAGVSLFGGAGFIVPKYNASGNTVKWFRVFSFFTGKPRFFQEASLMHHQSLSAEGALP